MVANLSLVREFINERKKINKIGINAQILKKDLPPIDDDTKAFDMLMSALDCQKQSRTINTDQNKF